MAFSILAPVKLASKRLLFVKFESIRDEPEKLTLVKLALLKFDFSKLPPSRLDSYKFARKKDDSEKFPNAIDEFIMILLSKFTLIKPENDKFEFGKKLLIGFVVKIKEQNSCSNYKLKKILEVIDEAPLIDKETLDLFIWVSK